MLQLIGKGNGRKVPFLPQSGNRQPGIFVTRSEILSQEVAAFSRQSILRVRLWYYLAHAGLCEHLSHARTAFPCKSRQVLYISFLIALSVLQLFPTSLILLYSSLGKSESAFPERDDPGILDAMRRRGPDRPISHKFEHAWLVLFCL